MKSNHEMLAKAIWMASEAHRDQLDKGGNAYILHPLRLMMGIQRWNDPELMIIAVLHDVYEDSVVFKLDNLIEVGFSPRVAKALRLLTHDNAVPYDEYIRGIATCRDAILVKMEDLKDNSDITRLKGLRQKDFERLEKYQRAFVFLKTALENFDTI